MTRLFYRYLMSDPVKQPLELHLGFCISHHKCDSLASSTFDFVLKHYEVEIESFECRARGLQASA